VYWLLITVNAQWIDLQRGLQSLPKG
jgi:hypothetical protein